MNDQEISILAEVFAKSEIKREKSHLNAYIKGKSHYVVYGRRHPVLTPEVLAERKEEEEYLNNLKEIEEE